MARRDEWVYDELLEYVACPLFQAPVMTFMEANCLSRYTGMYGHLMAARITWFHFHSCCCVGSLLSQ